MMTYLRIKYILRRDLNLPMNLYMLIGEGADVVLGKKFMTKRIHVLLDKDECDKLIANEKIEIKKFDNNLLYLNEYGDETIIIPTENVREVMLRRNVRAYRKITIEGVSGNE